MGANVVVDQTGNTLYYMWLMMVSQSKYISKVINNNK